MQPTANTPWEALIVLITGIAGATGLWRWIAARVARSDGQYDALRDKIELLTARVSASEAREALLTITLKQRDEEVDLLKLALTQRDGEVDLLKEQNRMIKTSLDRRDRRLRELGHEPSEVSDAGEAGGE